MAYTNEIGMRAGKVHNPTTILYMKREQDSRVCEKYLRKIHFLLITLQKSESIQFFANTNHQSPILHKLSGAFLYVCDEILFQVIPAAAFSMTRKALNGIFHCRSGLFTSFFITILFLWFNKFKNDCVVCSCKFVRIVVITHGPDKGHCTKEPDQPVCNAEAILPV